MNPTAVPTKPLPEPTKDERNSIMRMLNVGASPQEKLRTAQTGYQKSLADGKCYCQKLQEHDRLKSTGKYLQGKLEDKEKELVQKGTVGTTDFADANKEVRRLVSNAEMEAKTTDSKAAKSVKQEAKDEGQYQSKYQQRSARCERNLERANRRLQRLKKMKKGEKAKNPTGGEDQEAKMKALGVMLDQCNQTIRMEEKQQRLKVAAEQAEKGLFKTACKELKPLEKNLEKLAAKTKKEDSQEGKQLKGKGHWDRRKGKVEVLIANLEMVPPTAAAKAALAEIKQKLTELDAKAADGQYADAYKALGALKQAANKALDQADEDEDDLPVDMKRFAEVIKDQFKQVQELAPHEVDGYEDELNDTLALFMDSDKKDAAVKNADNFLKDLSERLTKEVTESPRAMAKKSYEKTRPNATENLKELEKYLSHKDLEEVRRLYEEAEEKAADGDYKAAGDLLYKLQNGKPEHSTQQMHYEKWKVQESNLKPLEQRLIAMVSEKITVKTMVDGKEMKSQQTISIYEKWPSVLDKYKQASDMLVDVKTLETERNFEAATKKLLSLGPKVKAAEDEAAKWKKYQDECKELVTINKEGFAKQDQAVGAAMEKLAKDLRARQAKKLPEAEAKALRERSPGFNMTDLGKHNEDYLEIRKTWNKEVREAQTSEELQKVSEKAMKALSDLEATVKDLASKPDEQEKLIQQKSQEKQYAEAMARYQNAEKTVEGLLKKLRETGSPDYARLEAEFKKAVSDAEGNIQKAAAEVEADPQNTDPDFRFGKKTRTFLAAVRPLEQLEVDIGREIKTKGREVKEARKTADDKMKEVKGQLEKVDFSKVPMDLTGALHKRRKELEPLLASQNVDALKVCEERLEAIAADLKAAADKPKAYDKIGNDLRDLRTGDLNEIKKLGAPKRFKELLGTLDKLESDFRKQPPKQAQDALDEFKKEVEVATKEATELRALRKKLKPQVEDAEDILKQLDREAKEKGGYDKYDGDLRRQLKSATALGKAESSVSVALAVERVKEIREEGQKLLAACKQAGPGQSPVVEEERERAEKEKALKLQQQILADEVANFEKGPLAQAKQALLEAGARGLKVDEKQLDFIEDSGKAAKKAGEKAKDINALNVARRQLEKAVAAAETLAEEPQGAEITSKQALGKLNVKWQEAIKKFKATVKELMKAVQDQSQDDKDDVKKEVAAVEKLTVKVLNLFRGKAFENVLKVLDAEPKADIKEQRKAREDGLRLVRSYRKTALVNPIIKFLMAAPEFNKKLDRRPLMAVLKDLETNLMRCVQK